MPQGRVLKGDVDGAPIWGIWRAGDLS